MQLQQRRRNTATDEVTGVLISGSWVILKRALSRAAGRSQARLSRSGLAASANDSFDKSVIQEKSNIFFQEVGEDSTVCQGEKSVIKRKSEKSQVAALQATPRVKDFLRRQVTTSIKNLCCKMLNFQKKEDVLTAEFSRWTSGVSPKFLTMKTCSHRNKLRTN